MTTLSRATAAVALILAAACRDTTFMPNEGNPPPEVTPRSSVPIDTGFIMRDGTPVMVVFEIRGGRAVFEGDIDLGPIESIARTQEELQRAEGLQLGSVHNSSSRRWPGGNVPYVIESNVPNPQRVQTAIAHIHSRVAGVVFQTRMWYDNNYIIFRRTTDPNICGSSGIGRVGGGQVLLVHDNCSSGPVIHELGHALGFWHEQSRCDRDNFVEIIWTAIQPGYLDQFEKHCANNGGLDLESYDEGSIMHYRSNAFGRVVNGATLQTIRSLRGLESLMGQINGLSTIDVFTTNKLY